MILHKNPLEESFLAWLNFYPESMHPCDMDRFYVFVKRVIMYNSKKWLKKEYFTKRILELKPNFDLDKIDILFERLRIIADYEKVYGGRGLVTNTEDPNIYQRMVINNIVYEVRITKEEFMRGGINKKEFISRLQ